jgi:hypothetical protein
VTIITHSKAKMSLKCHLIIFLLDLTVATTWKDNFPRKTKLGNFSDFCNLLKIFGSRKITVQTFPYIFQLQILPRRLWENYRRYKKQILEFNWKHSFQKSVKKYNLITVGDFVKHHCRIFEEKYFSDKQ